MRGFGHVVVGPPGSGKSTYCAGLQQVARAIGRKVCVVNLDPANDVPPYEPDVDIAELVDATEVMRKLQLGPNGALLYCMDFLRENADWLLERLRFQNTKNATDYFVFDMPGQLELYTHSDSVKELCEILANSPRSQAKNSGSENGMSDTTDSKTVVQLQLAVLNLVDSHYCTDTNKYLAVLLTSLNTMLHLELPHINALSKIDVLHEYGELDFSLEFYTETVDLRYLLDTFAGHDDDSDGARSRFNERFTKLNAAMIELLEDYALVNFHTLDVQDKHSMVALLSAVDACCGYPRSDLEAAQEWLAATIPAPEHPAPHAAPTSKQPTAQDILDPMTDLRIFDR